MNRILVKKTGWASIGRIVARMEDRFKEGDLQVRRCRVPGMLRRNRTINRNDVMIRFGCSDNGILVHPNALTYQQSAAIELAKNKLQARIKMRELGVPVPNLIEPNIDERGRLIPGWASLIPDVQAVARPMHHQAGNHFIVLKGLNDICSFIDATARDIRNWYISEVFDKNIEYRVHCAHGKILMCQNKGYDGATGDLRANQAVTQGDWVTVGFTDYRCWWAKPALKAVAALGLDYGAVDVMVKQRRGEDRSVAICEVNTAPSVEGEYWETRYAKYFQWLFSSPTRREHWNFDQFTAGTSLAWKDGQFV